MDINGVKGIKIIVAIILKTVWALAIWRGTLSDVCAIKSAKYGIQKQNNNTPIILKVTCPIATRLASRVAFNPARIAVTQVPILAPKINGIPASSVMDPPLAKVMTIPVVALLLWTKAVKIAPAIIPRNGFSKLVRILLDVGSDRSGFIVSDITFIP